MSRDNDEQRATSQTLCGALRKEANCKCLVLSVLIYGCLAAVTWCRCTNVTKVVLNYNDFPLRRTEHVSPCDEGYIYIPVAFMGMLYLVYLVECYHSPIRIDLLHAESQESVTTRLSNLRAAQPTIWWKAVSYHYVRRKRQITRYRNGDNYTTTQVYYERANTHAATSFYFYEYCGVRDISKDLETEDRIPITKIALTKGFAFSNMRSATEFEEARSRFFAEQELRDDYMEMREGLDLGHNFGPTTLVGVRGSPWFTSSYVYWSLSALLLSWPLRIIIEYNTQYAQYQITKLFGVNYDTPTSGGLIHASSSQLSAPGSYMLAPSYSEALLMESWPPPPPSTPPQQTAAEPSSNSTTADPPESDLVPSYSEALLYERAQQSSIGVYDVNATTICDCVCHTSTRRFEEDAESLASLSSMSSSSSSSSMNFSRNPESHNRQKRLDNPGGMVNCTRCTYVGGHEGSATTLPDPAEATTTRHRQRRRRRQRLPALGRRHGDTVHNDRGNCSRLTRELSAPNFQTNSESVDPSNPQFLRTNGNSLANILEKEEPSESTGSGTKRRSKASPTIETSSRVARGAIPKHKCRLTENPMIEEDEMPSSRVATSMTYFCLKSILKQHRRRYTLITPEELRKLTSDDPLTVDRFTGKIQKSQPPPSRYSMTRELHFLSKSKHPNTSRAQATNSFYDEKIGRAASTRSLIFPSPIEEACSRKVSNDPFGGKSVHVVPSARSEPQPPPQRSRSTRGTRNPVGRHRRNLSVEAEYPLATRGWNSIDEQQPLQQTFEINAAEVEVTRFDRFSPNRVPPIPGQCRRKLTRGLSLNERPLPPPLLSSKSVGEKNDEGETSARTYSLLSLNDYRASDGANAPTTARFSLNMETSL